LVSGDTRLYRLWFAVDLGLTEFCDDIPCFHYLASEPACVTARLAA